MDKIHVRKNVGASNEHDALVSFNELYEAQSPRDEWHGESTLTVSAKMMGILHVFSVGCTVTIPDGLPVGFLCGFMQAGNDPVTFTAADGVVLRGVNGNEFTTAGLNASGGMMRLSDGSYYVYGRLEP